MAGIFDEVMEGIAAKEKDAPLANGEKDGAKPMNTYSDDFKKTYGEKNNKKTS
jgi:hypothetical protein